MLERAISASEAEVGSSKGVGNLGVEIIQGCQSATRRRFKIPLSILLQFVSWTIDPRDHLLLKHILVEDQRKEFLCRFYQIRRPTIYHSCCWQLDRCIFCWNHYPCGSQILHTSQKAQATRWRRQFGRRETGSTCGREKGTSRCALGH